MTIPAGLSFPSFHDIQIRKRSRVRIDVGLYVGGDANATNGVHTRGVCGSNLFPFCAFARGEVHADDDAGQSRKIVNESRFGIGGKANQVFVRANPGYGARLASVHGIEEKFALRIHSLDKFSIGGNVDHRKSASFRADGSRFAAGKILDIKANALARLVSGEDNLFPVGSEAASDMIDRIVCGVTRLARLGGKEKQLSGRFVSQSQNPRAVWRERLRVSVT